mmetsp:Transcript_12922/g.24444  ORF Transcript_12922/g.24444 Transcript_12922/m.24444 type:complete len:207 (-) Transcript_12922:488-1108(-)
MEWDGPRQQQVGNHACAPHVSLRSVLKPHHFRRNIISGSPGLSQGPAEGGEVSAQPEIDRLQNLVLLVKIQEVLRLHITVDDAIEMAVREHHQNLPYCLCGSLFCVFPLLLLDRIKELSPFAHLHHNVHVPLVLERLEEGDDVFVATQLLHDLHLPIHILDAVSASNSRLGEYLHRDLAPAVPLIERQVRVPEAPFTHLVLHIVKL